LEVDKEGGRRHETYGEAERDMERQRHSEIHWVAERLERTQGEIGYTEAKDSHVERETETRDTQNQERWEREEKRHKDERDAERNAYAHTHLHTSICPAFRPLGPCSGEVQPHRLLSFQEHSLLWSGVDFCFLQSK
jgi:hypothetical protein